VELIQALSATHQEQPVVFAQEAQSTPLLQVLHDEVGVPAIVKYTDGLAVHSLAFEQAEGSPLVNVHQTHDGITKQFEHKPVGSNKQAD